MPQVNLSTMSGQELRQLLDSSRRRGDAALSYKILQEMAERREQAAERRPSARRRHAEPHLVAVDLGEPVEDADDLPPMPNWRPPPREPEIAAASPAPRKAAPAAPRGASRRKAAEAKAPSQAPALVLAVAPAAAAEPDLPPDEPPPLVMTEAEPQPSEDATASGEDWDLRLHPHKPPKAAPPARPRLRIAGFALGLILGTALGAALGWRAAGVVREGASPIAPAGSVRTAALAPAPAPPAQPPTAAASVPAAPAETTAPPPPDLPADAAAPAAEAPAAAPLPPAAPAPRVAEARTAEPAAAAACAAQPTPADREICGDPRLRRLQRELQRAYAQALDAHQDRALLRQRQLAWRDARSTVSDPDRLARLYQDRIRKLNAAAAEARGER